MNFTRRYFERITINGDRETERQKALDHCEKNELKVVSYSVIGKRDSLEAGDRFRLIAERKLTNCIVVR